MKRYTIFLTFLSIILLIILICTIVSAEGGRGSGGLGGGNNTYTSIWTGLLTIKYILGGFIALLGLVLLKTVKINQNTRTILMCFTFLLFGVLVIMREPSPLRAVVDPLTSMLTGSMIPI